MEKMESGYSNRFAKPVALEKGSARSTLAFSAWKMFLTADCKSVGIKIVRWLPWRFNSSIFHYGVVAEVD